MMTWQSTETENVAEVVKGSLPLGHATSPGGRSTAFSRRVGGDAATNVAKPNTSKTPLPSPAWLLNVAAPTLPDATLGGLHVVPVAEVVKTFGLGQRRLITNDFIHTDSTIRFASTTASTTYRNLHQQLFLNR